MTRHPAGRTLENQPPASWVFILAAGLAVAPFVIVAAKILNYVAGLLAGVL